MTTILNSPGEFEPLLTDIANQVAVMDYQPVLQQAQHAIAEYEAGMFAGGFDSNLQDWLPLRPSTVKKKRHDRILVESGDLCLSLVEVGTPHNINAAERRGLLFGTDLEYAGFLEYGTSKMPARPPVGLAAETLDKLCEQIADETVRQLTAGGS